MFYVVIFLGEIIIIIKIVFHFYKKSNCLNIGYIPGIHIVVEQLVVFEINV